jgi:hypothetical protein
MAYFTVQWETVLPVCYWQQKIPCEILLVHRDPTKSSAPTRCSSPTEIDAKPSHSPAFVACFWAWRIGLVRRF